MGKTGRLRREKERTESNRGLFQTVRCKASGGIKKRLNAVVKIGQFTMSWIMRVLVYTVQYLRLPDSTDQARSTRWYDNNYFWAAATVFVDLLIAAAAPKMKTPHIFLLLAWPVGVFVAHCMIKGLRLRRWIIIPCTLLIGCGLWLFDVLLNPVTYVYLLPGRGLCVNYAGATPESLPRRVFVVQQEGKGVLHKVEIVLHDNNQKDQTAVDHIEEYAEVDSKESILKGTQPKHFWFKPSTPWNENYTITIKSREKVLFERILVRGFAPPPTSDSTPSILPPPPRVEAHHGDASLPPEMGSVEFAIRVTTPDSDKAIFTCRDRSLINQADWQNDPVQSCTHHISDIPSFEGGLDPKPFVLAFPGGVIDMTPQLPPAITHSHPETESDIRRLSEWQKSQLLQTLSLYPKHKVLVVFVGGASTKHYAQDFVDIFRSSKWSVTGPIPLTIASNQGQISDVQVSIWKGDSGHEPQIDIDIHDVFKRTKIKGADRLVYGLNRSGVIVVPVGTKSPDEENPSDHPPYDLPEIDKLLDRYF